VSKVVELDAGRQASVLQRVVVAAAANVVAVQHEPFGTAEDELVESRRACLALPMLA
jgi:hypothetical protein